MYKVPPLPDRKFPIIKIVFFIVVIIGVTSGGVAIFKLRKTENICVNPYQLKDFTASKEIVRFCGDALYKGSNKVVSKSEFPDLFEYVNSGDGKSYPVEQDVRLFNDKSDEFVSFKSFINYYSWTNSAIGVYRKEGNKYNLVFKKSFKDNPGRWVSISFGDDYLSRDSVFFLSKSGSGMVISGDIGMLGCMGACRLLWWDYYEWDTNKKMYVLANNKHPEAFKKVLENYEEWDKTTCQTPTIKKPKTVTELYPLRKDKEKLCSDDAIEPATTTKEAEMLLKGIKAVKSIINGENIGLSQVKDVILD